MIYLIIALGATIIGSVSGLGGGVIIKPLLDLVTNNDVGTISILSTFTVFSMSVAALIKHIKYKTKIEYKIGIMLSIGALIGGNIGNSIFDLLLENSSNPAVVTLVQNLILIVLLIMVLAYMNFFKERFRYNLKNPIIIIGTGLGLGSISSFIGIGGGPINMAILTLFFSMNTKDAAVNSILLVFFSQLSKLVTIGFTGGFGAYSLAPLVYMIPAGIIGGIIGASLSKKLSSKTIVNIFNVANAFVIVIAMINLVNAIRVI